MLPWSQLMVSTTSCSGPKAEVSRGCCAWPSMPRTGLNEGAHARESCACEFTALAAGIQSRCGHHRILFIGGHGLGTMAITEGDYLSVGTDSDSAAER